MRATRPFFAAALVLAGSSGSHAAEAREGFALLGERNCAACHAATDKDPVVFPHGPAFAVLAESAAPWPAMEAGLKFRGCQLDALKCPMLLYSFREIGVEDFFTSAEADGKVSLRRALKFSGPPLDGFYFRLASGKLTPAGENTWRLDDALTLRVLAGGPAFTRGEGARRELLAPVRMENAKVFAQQKPGQNLNTDELAPLSANEREAEFYRIADVPMPAGAVLEAGSMLVLPDGRIVVGTRRGEIYFGSNLDATPPAPQWKLFATGLTEIFGLAMRGDILFATQQAEVTRVLDTDGDGRADRFETVSDAWAWGGEHEFNFGSPGFDKDGALWTVRGLTGRYTSERLFRGWALRHFPDGRAEPMYSGLHLPGVRDRAGQPLLHDAAYYTLNQIPKP